MIIPTNWNCFNCGNDIIDLAGRNPEYNEAWCAVCAPRLNSIIKHMDDAFLHDSLRINNCIIISKETALKATPHGPVPPKVNLVSLRVMVSACICTKCNSKNEFAEPNQKDGSYVCFECR